MQVGRRPRRGGDEARQEQRRSAQWRGTVRIWVAVAAVAASSALIGLWSGPPAGATTAPPYLLALGGSASVGFQPTLAHPRGQPTSSGYAEDLVPLEQQRWPGLTVVHLGCPGASTMTMLEGGGKCLYPEGSQLQAAEAFLRTHPTTALVTVDLGFNDLLSCLRHEVVDPLCVNEAIATVHDQLIQILAGIKAAEPSGTLIVGVGHYDPYLGDYLRSPGGQAFAAESLEVMERLDAALRADYTAAGLPMADVASAFDLTDRDQTKWSGPPTVPADVARTCALTWMCNGPPLGHNVHPDDAGYRAIASAIAAAVAGSPDRAGAGT
jgi:lysophospholipase L1-like esterase